MTTQTLTLADFLLARIAEDEALALEASWRFAERTATTEPVAEHIARHDPARVLAECEAKRRIVAEWLVWAKSPSNDPVDGGWDMALETAVQHLALPYADHSDYRQEWRS